MIKYITKNNLLIFIFSISILFLILKILKKNKIENYKENKQLIIPKNKSIKSYGLKCNPNDCKNKTFQECLKCKNCMYITKRGFHSKCMSNISSKNINKFNDYQNVYQNNDNTKANITVNEVYTNNSGFIF